MMQITDNNSKKMVLNDIILGYHIKGKGTKEVSQPINALLPEGKLTCLLGANGVGKSTMLRTIAGIHKPLAGTITINGKLLEKYSLNELARLVSVVLTDKVPSPTLRAHELVEMGRLPYTSFWGVLHEKDKFLTKESIHRVGMASFWNRKLSSMSDGEVQKLMIARALAQHTPIMIFDEPICFLDFPSKVEILKLLSQIAHQEGITMLLSLHEIDLALQMADNLWLFDTTGYLYTGTPSALAAEGRLASLFASTAIQFNPETLQYSIKK